MVVATNKNATREQNSQLEEEQRPRTWKPVEKSEIYRWLGTLIYMGLHPEKVIDLYWAPESRSKRWSHSCLCGASNVKN